MTATNNPYSRPDLLGPGGIVGVTLMTFTSADDPDNARMFVAADDGNVYDVTDFAPNGTTFASVLTVPGQTNPGETYWVNAITQGGSFLCVVFPGAGYWTFDGTVWVEHPTGSAAGQIGGIDPKKFGYILVWQNRLIFLETGTGNAWYLAVNELAGTAAVFEFGMQFTRGGFMAVMAPWTSDSGDGVFSRMVIVSSEGDVLIYAGSDVEDAATFKIMGKWYVGRVPAGRRFITRFGSDMAILSERGLLMMSDILRGSEDASQGEATKRINPLLQPDVRETLGARFWELRVLTDVNLMIINAPVRRFNTDYVWAIDLNSFGASKMTNFPFSNIEMFKGSSYGLDDVGRVWKLWTGSQDGVVGATPGSEVEGRVQTSFVSLGEAVRWKRFLMVRAGFRSLTPPGVQLAMNGEWNFAAPDLAPVYNLGAGSFWNSGAWNSAVWLGGEQTYKSWVGASGMGHYAALSMRVRGEPGTLFTDWDCVVEAGGIL